MSTKVAEETILSFVRYRGASVRYGGGCHFI